MSFAINQLLMNATAELNELNAMSVKDTATRNRINSLTKEIRSLNKQIADYEAAHPTAPAPVENTADEPKDAYIVCRDCNKEFCFSVDDQYKYWQRDWSDPIRCDTCREQRRANRVEPVVVECCDCGTEFKIGAGRQAFITENGHSMPKRCRDCSQANREKRENAAKAKLINCSKCRQDFSHSAAAQARHTENKWPDPKFCKPCRDARKAQSANNNTRSSNASKSSKPTA
jgi:hypothetical protein